MGEAKPTFAPLPMRCFADHDLCGADFRVLGQIAGHDQLNKNGQGCWAGQKGIAAKLKLDLTTVSKSIARLLARGYLREGEHPMDRRRRVLFVVYNEEDAEALRGDGNAHTRGALKVVRNGDGIDGESAMHRKARKARDNDRATDKIDGETTTYSANKTDRPTGAGNSKLDDRGAKLHGRPKLQVPVSVGESQLNIFRETEEKKKEGFEGVQAGDGLPKPDATRRGQASGETSLWKRVDESLSPADQWELLRAVHHEARPSAALREYQAALQSRRGAA